jgi:cAMP-dependent protein kinase regulator
MNKKKISPKEEAQRALSRGDWKKALEHFQKHYAREPNDLRSGLKIAELLERLGKKKEAVQVYRRIAEAYAQDGFLLQAISINKMILRIDCASKDASERLAQLYMEKTCSTGGPRSFPHIPLFSELGEEELRLLLSQVRVRTFPEGSPICKEGGEGDSLFVISRGEAAVTKGIPGGREVWVRNLRVGDFFGEFGFFTDQKRHATVKALSECEMLEISRKDLDQLMKTHRRVKDVLENLFKERVLDLFLALSPLFSPLTSAEREEVFKRFRLHKVPAETVLFQRGDPPESLYMIKSGQVEIFARSREGKKIIVSKMRSGNILGEIGLLFSRTRMASARTTQASELLELTREDLEACLTQFPKLRETLKEISFKRVVQMNEILSQEKVERAREGMV